MKKLLTPLLILLAGTMSAQEIRLEGIPYKFSVCNTPINYSVAGSRVEIEAQGGTNLINNPSTLTKIHSAPMVVFEPEGDFTLSAKVSGELTAIYDVAALVVYQDEDTWAKVCYENSVKKQPTIVSVVTRTYSDDCNSMGAGDFAYLSVVKKGEHYSFFYSKDGVEWDMVRSFNLRTDGKIKVGFAAHGSRGDGFTGVFTDIKFVE